MISINSIEWVQDTIRGGTCRVIARDKGRIMLCTNDDPVRCIWLSRDDLVERDLTVTTDPLGWKGFVSTKACLV